MFLDIIIIVLRETLEASVLVAVLLSIAKNQCIGTAWLSVACFPGFFGAIVYGVYMGDISEWADYAGQELVNASLQILLYLLIVFLIPIQWIGETRSRRLLQAFLVFIVSIAFIREGAEIYIFYSGFLQQEGVAVKALSSGFVGLAVGLSVGAIAYYVLVMISPARVRLLHATILALIAAGMVLQATQLLIQVDWISIGSPLWDSNSLLAESSLMGQVAYAIFGYEATPSFQELLVYLMSICFLIAITMFVVPLGTRRRAVNKAS